MHSITTVVYLDVNVSDQVVSEIVTNVHLFNGSTLKQVKRYYMYDD